MTTINPHDGVSVYVDVALPSFLPLPKGYIYIVKFMHPTQAAIREGKIGRQYDKLNFDTLKYSTSTADKDRSLSPKSGKLKATYRRSIEDRCGVHGRTQVGGLERTHLLFVCFFPRTPHHITSLIAN